MEERDDCFFVMGKFVFHSAVCACTSRLGCSLDTSHLKQTKPLNRVSWESLGNDFCKDFRHVALPNKRL